MLSGFDTPKEQREYYKGQPKPKLGLHESLDLLGQIPLGGEPFDLMNAALYGLKGKKGDAALSLMGAVTGFGSITAFRKTGVALKRGIKTPSSGHIRSGELYGGPKYEGGIFATESPLISSGYADDAFYSGMSSAKMAERHVAGAGYADDAFFNNQIRGRGEIIDLDIPQSFMDRFAVGGPMWREYGRFESSGGRLIPGAREIEFTRPIPEKYIMGTTPVREINRNVLSELGRIN
tara:strand:+ start:7320 stop:8024 length:705 start_codon:yes stop_codon:yes gene_type:complete